MHDPQIQYRNATWYCRIHPLTTKTTTTLGKQKVTVAQSHQLPILQLLITAVMSEMRWADSDSESEEEYIPPSFSDPQEALPPEVEDRHAPISHPINPGRGGGGGRRGRSEAGRHHSESGNHYDRGHGDRGGGRSGRGGRGGRHATPQQDWRQMAKESSRFARKCGWKTPSTIGELCNDFVDPPRLTLFILAEPASTTTLDGSAWMAQRRAKREQENNDRREQEKQQQFYTEQEKRERRKSQLHALKEVVSHLQEAPPKAVTSLQRAALTGQPLLTSPPHSPPRKPVQILSRSHEPPQEQGKWPRNTRAEDPSPPLHNLTILPKPRGELQADGTVKFVKPSSEATASQEKEAECDADESHVTNNDEHSLTSKGSKGSKKKRYNKRRGNRGRGSGQSDENQHDEISVGSNRSRGGRGGRRGRGGRENDRGGRGRGRDNQRGGRRDGRGSDKARDSEDNHGGRDQEKHHLDHQWGGRGGRTGEGGTDDRDSHGRGRHSQGGGRGRGGDVGGARDDQGHRVGRGRGTEGGGDAGANRHGRGGGGEGARGVEHPGGGGRHGYARGRGEGTRGRPHGGRGGGRGRASHPPSRTSHEVGKD